MDFAAKIKNRIDKPIFRQLSEVAEEEGVPCYVVGGYVRDIILERPSKDIDVVVVGSGIAVAERYAKKLGKGKTVVTVLPDTAERYFSTPLFD